MTFDPANAFGGTNTGVIGNPAMQSNILSMLFGLRDVAALNPAGPMGIPALASQQMFPQLPAPALPALGGMAANTPLPTALYADPTAQAASQAAGEAMTQGGAGVGAGAGASAGYNIPTTTPNESSSPTTADLWAQETARIAPFAAPVGSNPGGFSASPTPSMAQPSAPAPGIPPASTQSSNDGLAFNFPSMNERMGALSQVINEARKPVSPTAIAPHNNPSIFASASPGGFFSTPEQVQGNLDAGRTINKMPLTEVLQRQRGSIRGMR